jgi:hypothetical protein
MQRDTVHGGQRWGSKTDELSKMRQAVLVLGVLEDLEPDEVCLSLLFECFENRA